MTLRLSSVSFLGLASFLLILLAIALRLLGASNMAYLMLAFMATLSPRHVLRALVLAWLLQIANPGLVVQGDSGALGRYILLFVSAISVVIRSQLLAGKPKMPSIILYTLFISFFLVLHGIIFSPILDVTILRVVSWTVAMTSAAGAWLLIKKNDRNDVAEEVFWWLVAIMIVSVPFVFNPVGFLRNGTGFQGIVNHPQVYGQIMALIGVWSIGRLLGSLRPSWHLIIIAGCALWMILLSETRTAALAMFLGLLISVLFISKLSGKSVRDVLPGLRSKRVLIVFGVVTVLMMISAPLVGKIAYNFITKSSRADVSTLAEAYDVSRGGVIRKMRDNIERDPLGGIGFGVPSDIRGLQIERDPILGLPTSAPVEKGVTPLAIIEETGVFGFVLIAIWLFWIVRRSAIGGIAPLAVIITILLFNFAEAHLFSAGGFGLITFILIFWAFTVPEVGEGNRRNGTLGRVMSTKRVGSVGQH